jgi:hypothetical protein
VGVVGSVAIGTASAWVGDGWARSRGEGEVAGVGGEGGTPVRWRGRRRREGGASALDRVGARMGSRGREGGAGGEGEG